MTRKGKGLTDAAHALLPSFPSSPKHAIVRDTQQTFVRLFSIVAASLLLCYWYHMTTTAFVVVRDFNNNNNKLTLHSSVSHVLFEKSVSDIVVAEGEENDPFLRTEHRRSAEKEEQEEAARDSDSKQAEDNDHTPRLSALTQTQVQQQQQQQHLRQQHAPPAAPITARTSQTPSVAFPTKHLSTSETTPTTSITTAASSSSSFNTTTPTTATTTTTTATTTTKTTDALTHAHNTNNSYVSAVDNNSDNSSDNSNNNHNLQRTQKRKKTMCTDDTTVHPAMPPNFQQQQQLLQQQLQHMQQQNQSALVSSAAATSKFAAPLNVYSLSASHITTLNNKNGFAAFPLSSSSCAPSPLPRSHSPSLSPPLKHRAAAATTTPRPLPTTATTEAPYRTKIGKASSFPTLSALKQLTSTPSLPLFYPPFCPFPLSSPFSPSPLSSAPSSPSSSPVSPMSPYSSLPSTPTATTSPSSSSSSSSPLSSPKLALCGPLDTRLPAAIQQQQQHNCFQLEQQPHSVQRKSYRSENRSVKPNPLVLCAKAPQLHRLRGKISNATATVSMVNFDCSEISDENLRNAVTGIHSDNLTEFINQDMKATFHLKLQQTSAGRLFRFKFRVRYQLRVSEEGKETIAIEENLYSDPFCVYSNIDTSKKSRHSKEALNNST